MTANPTGAPGAYGRGHLGINREGQLTWDGQPIPKCPQPYFDCRPGACDCDGMYDHWRTWGPDANSSRPDSPPGCEPAAPVEPKVRPTAPGAPDPWYDDETEWLDQLSPPWWGHLWRAWQTIEQWIIDNRPTSREWR